MRGPLGGIVVVLALGLVLRAIIAYILPGSGFGVDLSAFRFWAGDLAQNGPWGFYSRPFFHDYTPGYLYVLWLIGIVERFVPSLDLIKVPAMLADVAVGWLIWSMAIELGAGRRAALIGAALYLFLPVTWFDSVVWGQVDSVGIVFLLLGLRELWRDHPERATALGVIAAVIKPQLGILVPIGAAVLIRRYVIDHPDVRDLRRGPARIVTSAAAGLATAVALCAPFRFSVLDLIAQVQKTAGGYPYLTVNADNPWALVTDAAGSGLAQSGQWLCDAVTGTAAGTPCPPGAEVLIGPVPAVVVGTGVFLIAVAIVTAIVAWRPDRLTALIGLTALAVAFFVLPTRVHERYLFPFFALAAIPAAVSSRWRVAYLALGTATFLNMYVVLTTLYPNNPNISDWLGIGSAIRAWSGVAAVATIVTVGFAWVVVQLRPGALRSLARAFATSASTPPDPAPTVRHEPRLVTHPDPATLARSGLWAPSEPVPSGVLAAIRRRLSARSLRADRSRGLTGEIGGRLDRLDVWLVVVLVAVSLVARMWRLGEPTSMHFDEVYHARTATEFLQDWRYGQPHAIYEFTHPHLAKYAMALGIIAWGDDRTTSTSDLGVPIRDVAIETRWDDPLLPDDRAGDRFYVATGSEVRAYDLQTRQLIATIPSPGATELAVDQAGHRLFVGTAAGAISVIDTRTAFDALRTGTPAAAIGPPAPFASVGGPIRQLFATDDGTDLVALTTDGKVVSIDGGTGAVVGSVSAPGAVDIASAGTTQGLVADPGAVADASAAASALASITGGDPAAIRARLVLRNGRAVVAGELDPTVQNSVQAAISDGRLAGFSFAQLPEVAVADTAGITIVSAADGTVVASVPIAGGVTGLALTSGLDAPRLYAASGSSVTVVKLAVPPDTSQPVVETTIPMPAPVTKVTFDPASVMVHVLGLTPDRTSPTIYVIEPHGNAVYADARLPFTPSAWATDVAPLYPSVDRQAILAVTPSGSIASVDIGNHEFSWRVPGVILGSLTIGLLFLLTRLLFRRRVVGVLVGVLSLVDGMLFVQSRIAMNDVYVGFFLMAAYVVFAGLWLGIWRRRWAFWVGMPAIGVLLGLGLASKWVAAYAIAATGLLILLRSALGRVLAIVGMIAVTVVLGFMGLATSAPEAGQVASGGANYLFMFLMMGLTLVAVVVAILHPIAWSREEMWFAVGAPTVTGVALGLAGIALAATGTGSGGGPLGGPANVAIGLGIALLGLAGAIVVAFRFAGRYGFGPLAVPAGPDDPARFLEPPAPAPEGWLRPGTGYGLPVVWMLGSLLVIPIVIYIVLYIPWALNSGGPAGSPLIFPAGTPIIGAWPPGHTGQTLFDLTKAMYAYHNDLRATHPASSPWWAWPFDLKPVWFYQGSFSGNTAAAIYDAGNLVTWWLGVPAMGFVVWQAFKRRSPGLALVAIAFAFQWLSWARIDRATFEYHYYTCVPFVIVALAYLLAELWHGASARTWLLARVSAAVAVMGPGLLWLFKGPLCAFVGVDRANPGSQACTGDPATIVLTTRTAGLVLVVAVGLIALAYQLAHLAPAGDGSGSGRSRIGIGTLLATAAAAAVALIVVGALLGDAVLLDLPGLSTAPLAIGAVVVLALVAWFVLGARDPRRFVVGTVVAAAAEFLIFYPNIAALPLPATIFNAYQGLLPTYLYPFQFPTNTNPPAIVPSLFAPDPSFLGLPPGPVLATFLTVACLVVAYSAWTWRIALAERDALAAAPGDASGAVPSG